MNWVCSRGDWPHELLNSLPDVQFHLNCLTWDFSNRIPWDIPHLLDDLWMTGWRGHSHSCWLSQDYLSWWRTHMLLPLVRLSSSPYSPIGFARHTLFALKYLLFHLVSRHQQGLKLTTHSNSVQHLCLLDQTWHFFPIRS